MSRLKLNERREGDVFILEVAGDLVLDYESGLLRLAVDAALDACHRKILLNLAQIRHVDSMGAGTLVVSKTSAQQRGVQLKLCAVPTLVRQVLERLHVVVYLDMYDQEDEALRAFQEQAAGTD